LGKLIFKLINKALEEKKWKMIEWAKVLYIIIGIAFLIQFYSTVKTLIIEWPQFFYKPPKLQIQTLVGTAGKPDIYYIVLDRYTSSQVLQSQFNFDNSDFTNYLQKNGFSINNNAKDNYPYTTMSISSTLNVNYLSDIVNKFSGKSNQTLEPYHEAIRYSSVIEQLKSLGYSYYHLGTWYEASNQAPLADYYYQQEGQLYILNNRITLNGFSKQKLNESIYWQFVNYDFKIKNFHILNYTSQDQMNQTLSNFDTLENLANQKAGGRFIFAHILVPHEDYYFNADGSINTNHGSDSVGEPIKQKYLNQVEFVNSQMKSIIDKINQKSSGKSLIILQADEGPYPLQLNSEVTDFKALGDELNNQDMGKWSTTDLQMKYGILAAYHLPGVSSQEINSGANSVNIFRLIFNKYFDANMPYLPECYYAYPNGRGKAEVYEEISPKLTGAAANPVCSLNSNFLQKK
jgi:hypothetical protein